MGTVISRPHEKSGLRVIPPFDTRNSRMQKKGTFGVHPPQRDYRTPTPRCIYHCFGGLRLLRGVTPWPRTHHRGKGGKWGKWRREQGAWGWGGGEVGAVGKGANSWGFRGWGQNGVRGGGGGYKVDLSLTVGLQGPPAVGRRRRGGGDRGRGRAWGASGGTAGRGTARSC